MKRMNKGLAIFMSFLLCIQGLNFSMSANAEELKAARIIEFNSLDESIAFQTLPIGACIDDVVFPDSIKAKVETTEKESAKESVEKSEQTEKTETNAKKEEIEKKEQSGKAEEKAEETAEETEKQEQTEKTENNAEKTETEKKEQSGEAEEKIEETEKKEQAEETEKKTEEPENNDQVEETEKETETAEDEAADSERATETETVAEPDEPEQVEEPKQADEEVSESGTVDIGLLDIIFPAIIAHAAEDDESTSDPNSSEIDVTPVLSEEKQETETNTATEIETDTNTETETEKQVIYTEITIENVTWQEAEGKQFDSSNEASFTFEPVFTTDYAVDAALPTIIVSIVKTDISTAFEKTAVVDGVCVSVIADPGVFPDDATLSVERVVGADLQAVEEAVDKERADDKNKAESYTFDIKVIDKDGNEIDPDNSKGHVKVSFTLEEVANVNLETDVYHVKGEVGDLSADKLETTETAETTVEAVTDGFSFYTVEFTYGNLQYVLKGGSSVALSEVLQDVGLSGEVTNASVSDERLISVSNETGEWIVTANQAFSTKEWLKVTLAGVEFEIVVTDSEDVASVTEGETTTHYTDFATAVSAWNNAASGATLTLLADVEISSTISVSGTKSIDLNGYGIKMTGSGRVFMVTNGANMTLYDSNATRTDTGANRPDGVSGGYITGGNTKNESGSCVRVESGSVFNMYGGNITGNTLVNGGGAVLVIGGNFNMYGGSITGNMGDNNCGGVWVHSKVGSTFNMYCGTITNNKLYDVNAQGVMTTSSNATIGDFGYSEYVSVTFDANGGTGSMPLQKVRKNTDTTIFANVNCSASGISDPAFSREGHDFAGWNTQADGEGTNYTAGTSTINISEATTLYAQWTTSVASVTYKVVNGAWSDGTTEDKTESVASGSKPASVPTGMKASEGYTGGAWDTNPAETTITESTTFTYTFDEKQASTITKTPAARNLNYSGQAQELVTAGEATGGVMQYVLGTDATTTPTTGYTTSIPTATEAKTYYVWYIVKGDENHTDSDAACVTVKVNKADSVVSQAPTSKNPIYNGYAQALMTAGTAMGGTMYYALGTETEVTEQYTTSIPSGTDVGTYYVWYKVMGDGNHNDSNAELVTVNIAKASNTVTVSITGWTYGGYNSTANAPIATADWGIDTVSFTYSNSKTGKYTETVPENAGTHYVKAIIAETEDYNGAESEPVSFVILPKALTDDMLALSEASFEHDGTIYAPAITVKDGTNYLVKDTDYRIDSASTTSASAYGSYIIKVNGKGNYTGSVSKDWNITDNKAPEIEITIRESSIKSAFNAITFGLFFNETETVTITATDEGSGVNQVSYFTSETAVSSVEELTALVGDNWKEGNSFSKDPNVIFIVYAKVTDKAGNTGYAASNGVVLDNTKPVVQINGANSQTEYHTAASWTTADDYLDSVVITFTAEGETAGTEIVNKNATAGVTQLAGDSSLSELGSYTIAAKDKAGNQTEVTFAITGRAAAITGRDKNTVFEEGKTYDLSQLFTVENGVSVSSYAVIENVDRNVPAGAGTIDGMQLTITQAGLITIQATIVKGKTIPAAPETVEEYIKETTATATLSVGKAEGSACITVSDAVYGNSIIAQTNSTTNEGTSSKIIYIMTADAAGNVIPEADRTDSETKPVGVGTYKAVVTYEATELYKEVNAETIFKITPAALTITAEAKEKTYGETDPAFTYTVSGLKYEDKANSVLSGALTRAESENAGTYSITQGTLQANEYYTISYTKANLKINKATLAVTAEAKSKAYGEEDPELTYQVSGLKNGDTAGVLTGTLTRDSGVDVGTYAITQGTLTANGNYTISFTGAYFKIMKAEPTVTAPESYSLTYSAQEQELIKAGVASGGTMYYALGTNATTAPADDLYTTSIPTATDAKTYYVWYKVMGDSNHNDSDPMCVVVTIDYVTVAVTFDANGGMGTIEDQILIYNVEQALTANAFTRDDYSFSGWNTKSDGTGTPYSDEAGVALTDNLTLYAQWSAKPLYRISGTVKQGGNAISGVTIRLVKGSKKIAVTSTNASGEFSFSAPEDVYNIIAEKDGKTNTTLVTLNQEQTIEIIMPSANVNSLLVLNNGNTPNVMVGGLDELAETYRENGKSVTVTMTVEEKSGDQATGSAEIENIAAGMKLEYLDIYLTKTMDSTESQVTEANSVLEIVVPYDFSKKKQTIVKVYRYHDTSAIELAENDTKADGTYQLDKENNLVYIYANLFSTYAIGFIPTYKVSGNISFGSYTGEVSFSLTGNDITKTETSIVTNGSGSYSFTGLPAGTYNVTASWNEGGKAQSLTFTVTVPT